MEKFKSLKDFLLWALSFCDVNNKDKAEKIILNLFDKAKEDLLFPVNKNAFAKVIALCFNSTEKEEIQLHIADLVELVTLSLIINNVVISETLISGEEGTPPEIPKDKVLMSGSSVIGYEALKEAIVKRLKIREKSFTEIEERFNVDTALTCSLY